MDDSYIAYHKFSKHKTIQTKIVQARNLNAQYNKPIKELDTRVSEFLYMLRLQITICSYTLNKAN